MKKNGFRHANARVEKRIVRNMFTIPFWTNLVHISTTFWQSFVVGFAFAFFKVHVVLMKATA